MGLPYILKTAVRTFQAANDLYSEIEKLSAAWDSLDRQNKAKELNMESMEAKIQKLAAEV